MKFKPPIYELKSGVVIFFSTNGNEMIVENCEETIRVKLIQNIRNVTININDILGSIERQGILSNEDGERIKEFIKMKKGE